MVSRIRAVQHARCSEREVLRCGYPGAVDAELPDRTDLIRLAAVTEIVIAVAERVDGEIADEAVLAELHELHDRALSALRETAHRQGAKGES
jgi:hypothetical protein